MLECCIAFSARMLSQPPGDDVDTTQWRHSNAFQAIAGLIMPQGFNNDVPLLLAVQYCEGVLIQREGRWHSRCDINLLPLASGPCRAQRAVRARLEHAEQHVRDVAGALRGQRARRARH